MKIPLKSVPFQLFTILIIVSTFGQIIPEQAVGVLYTLSMLIKDLLMAFLPIAIFTYIALSIQVTRVGYVGVAYTI